MAAPDELIHVVRRLSFCADAADVVRVLREAARRLTRADGVTVVLRDGDQCHYVDEDAIEPLWKGRKFPLESCVSGWCMLHRTPVAIGDIYADARIPHDAYRPTFVKSLAMVPIRSEDPIGALGAYWARHRDPTEEELAVMQSLADAAAMALANVKLIESLREASRQKDEFMAMLAHELRNPLAPIQNALYLQRLKPNDLESLHAARAMMERQVGHLGRLVDDLLDASRISTGKVRLHREWLDLARLARQVAEDRRLILEERGLELRLQIPDCPVWVLADATRMAQVLGNALDNAKKFSTFGGKVEVAVDEASEALLTVTDTGQGMDRLMLARVFDVFAQEDHSLARTPGGLGLGLSIAKGLVEMHGGRIEVESAGPGKGTQLRVHLPLSGEPPALSGEPVTEASKPQGVRVLIVEDNRDAAESLKLLMQLYGYEVTLAESGTEAVEAAMRVRPQVVLCDIGLPEMDGFEVARTLRGNQTTAQSKLIAVTGYGSDEDRRKAREAGFDAHLVKPVDPQRLLQQLGSLP